MRNLNWDKELKKVQRRGLYNPKVRVFSIIAVAILTLGIGLTFSAFSYSSGDNQAFNSKVNKKVKVVINVSNGSGAVNTTTNYKSSGTVEYSVTPNSGYILDETNTTCNYNSSTKKVIITPTSDTNCTVSFKYSNTLVARILSDNNLITKKPDFSKGEPPYDSNLTNTGSGLYATEDDDGISYYFRGNIENNYVSFADNLWRIVRVNGDGSIRLITNEHMGITGYNDDPGSLASAGYTKGNTHICTKANPCSTSDGTNSNIKNVIDSWYQTNIIDKGYDDKIAISSFCNDTTLNAEGNTFGTDTRLRNSTPSLKCPDTTQNYGGYYKMKVGILSADEMMLAGYNNIGVGDASCSCSDNPNECHIMNYLNDENGDYLYTMSPSFSKKTSSFGIYAGNYSFFIHGDVNIVSDELDFSPVISLKSDATITSGNGTKDNPYVIN